MKKYQKVQAIICNKIMELYVSHEEETSPTDFGDTYTLLICGMPDQKIEKGYFKKKKNKFSPRFTVGKDNVLFI